MANPPVAILCGGRGTRLRERTGSIPKPLVEIGGRPILWHVIQIYRAQSFHRFVLCTGHMGEMIEDFVRSEDWPPETEIECLETGADTPTGGRIKLAESRLGEEMFLATYSDGVADIDLSALLRQHRSHGKLGTVTVVRPTLQFGVADLDGDGRVTGFREKPPAEHWMNGGFFCFEHRFLDYLELDSVLEREPLEALVAEGELQAYRHDGFWDCMDTYKDAVELNDLWASGKPPWRVWS